MAGSGIIPDETRVVFSDMAKPMQVIHRLEDRPNDGPSWWSLIAALLGVALGFAACEFTAWLAQDADGAIVPNKEGGATVICDAFSRTPDGVRWTDLDGREFTVRWQTCGGWLHTQDYLPSPHTR